MGDDRDRDAPPGDADDEPLERARKRPQLDLTPTTLAALTNTPEDEESEPRRVDRGPRPRALSRPRIDVKTDASSPRVRSGKLTPLRRVRTSSNPLLNAQTPDPERPNNSTPDGADQETAESTPAAAATPSSAMSHRPSLSQLREEPSESRARPASRMLMPLQVLSALLLFDAALLPALRGSTLVTPWSALTDPASPNFVAAAFLALMALLFAFPLGRVLRVGLTAAVAGLLVVFSLVLLRSALASQAFDGQPALTVLFGEGFVVGALITLAACTLPMALVWRHVAPQSVRARLTATTGIVLVLFVYFGLQTVTSLDGSPIGLVASAGAHSAFLGDRVASWLAWLPLLLAFASLVVWLPAHIRGFAGPLAIAFWVTTMLPLLVLSFFVASADQWHAVLLPLQLTSLLAAGTLLLKASLGHLFGFLEAGDN